MGILAISEYMRHGKRNLFIVLQIALLLFVLCVSINTVLSEYDLYRPVQKMNGKKGEYVSASGYWGETAESIVAGMKKVESVYTWASAGLVTEEDKDMKTAVYPQNVLGDFEPSLQEGRWLDGVPMEDGILPIVVSQNPYGWKKDSLIPFQYYDATGKAHDIQARVIGVLEEGARVIGRGFGQGDIYHYDYRDIFSTYRYEQEQSVLLMVGAEQADKAGIPYTFDQDHFILYQDDITEYEQEDNADILKMNLGEMAADTTTGDPLETFMKNSNHQFQGELMMYLPITICVLVITIISLVNVCTLNMADDLYHNAIFSLLGLPWKKCSVFSFIQSIFTAFLSVILFFVLLLLTVKLKLTDYLLVGLNRTSIGVLIGTLIFLCAIHYIVPYTTLCRKQPVDVLRERKE